MRFAVGRSHEQRHDRRGVRRPGVVLGLALILVECQPRAPGRCRRRCASRCRSGGRIVTTTSTRVPGTTNPATPMTSLTLTDIARMPGGMVGGSPDRAHRRRACRPVMGSFSSTAVRRPRPTALLMSSIEPGHDVTRGPRQPLHVALGELGSDGHRARGHDDKLRHAFGRIGSARARSDKRQSSRWPR